MDLKDLVRLFASSTIVSVNLHEIYISKTAIEWYQSKHDWLEREVVQVQVETFKNNTISVVLNHSQSE